MAELPVPEGPVARPALAWLAGAELPQQHNLGTGFGQPALTVYRDEDFIVYLLFWFEETVTVHDHRFAGAFSIIEGQSLQNTYEFEPRDRLWPGLEVGRLRAKEVEVLAPGMVRVIPAGRALVHSNIHFGQPLPTVSLVARTIVKDGAPEQYSYSSGGLAVIDEPRAQGTVKRLEGLTASCRLSAEVGAAYLDRAIVSAVPVEVMAYVAAATRYFGSGIYLAPFLERSVISSSSTACSLALDYARQLHTSFIATDELRAAADDHDRLLLALVAAGTDWRSAGTVVGSALPGVTLPAALTRLAVAAARRSSVAGRPSATRLSDQALAFLSPGVAGSPGAPAASPPPAVYAELVAHRLFGPMFRYVLSDEDAA